MSSISDIAAASLAHLRQAGVIGDDLTLQDETLCIEGRPVLLIPRQERAWSWRTTVNRSLLPASVSAENRRHLLYAVLQDLVPQSLLLHENTSTARPLATFDGQLAPFDDVYRVPADRASDRLILFPIHVAVPTVFDTYERKPRQKPQTDKGFRGKFIDFFSSDESGFFDDHLFRVLRNLFARTEGLTPLDQALVRALGSRVIEAREESLRELLGDARFESAKSGHTDWWQDIYPPLPSRSDFRPLEEFALQGRRLHDDIDAIAHSYGLSRIERVAFVERLLAYHFALYMVRLTRVVYRELDRACHSIWPDRSESPWSGQQVNVRFHARRPQVPREHYDEYEFLVDHLNEAYITLPVLNNIELAIRAVAIQPNQEAARMNDGMWVGAKQELDRFDRSQLGRVRQILSFLALQARGYLGLPPDSIETQEVVREPVETLFHSVRLFYTAPDQRRYPKDHHQVVFDTICGSGSTSFLQAQPYKHVVLGDDLIYLLVLALFEHRDPHERGDSTFVPRDARRLRRQRLPLREFEDRLEQDLLVPADDSAREDLRASLARLGLIDRLSDVGDGNFLRHPTGI